MITLSPDDINWSYCYHLGQNVIIWDKMLLSRMKFYHLGRNVINWDESYHLGCNVIIWS
jgi:hypothetical protein